jgi:hypothetical protein
MERGVLLCVQERASPSFRGGRGAEVGCVPRRNPIFSASNASSLFTMSAASIASRNDFTKVEMAAPSFRLRIPVDTALRTKPCASTASSANSIGGISNLTRRSGGKSRLRKNFSKTLSPARARSMPVRTSASAWTSIKAAATMVVRFLDPGLRPALPLRKGRPRTARIAPGLGSRMTRASFKDAPGSISMPNGPRTVKLGYIGFNTYITRVNPAYLRGGGAQSASAPRERLRGTQSCCRDRTLFASAHWESEKRCFEPLSPSGLLIVVRYIPASVGRDSFSNCLDPQSAVQQ